MFTSFSLLAEKGITIKLAVLVVKFEIQNNAKSLICAIVEFLKPMSLPHGRCVWLECKSLYRRRGLICRSIKSNTSCQRLAIAATLHYEPSLQDCGNGLCQLAIPAKVLSKYMYGRFDFDLGVFD